MPVDMSDETRTPDESPAAEHDTMPVAVAGPDPAPPVAEDVASDTGDETPAPAEIAAEAPAEPAAEVPPAPPESKKKWYVVKVQSGREDTIKAAIERKVKIEGLEDLYGQIAVPVEEYVEKKKVNVTDKKTGQKVTQEKNVVKYRKKFHGYIFAEVEFSDRILYLFRETSGVGDFVGAAGPMKPPEPMKAHEVQTMLTGIVNKNDPNNKNRKVKVKLDYEKGDKVRIKDGAFAGSEGEVKSITEPKDAADTPKVTVIVTIWGRPVELEELDYWHVDKV